MLKNHIDNKKIVVTDDYGAYRNLHNTHSGHIILTTLKMNIKKVYSILPG